jgi:hypothetical protein
MATALTIPLDAWVGLVAVGSATEVAGNNYTRQPVHLEYCADGVTVANLAAVQWQQAKPLAWGAIDLVDIWDSQTGGTLLATLETDMIVTVSQYAIPRIPPAGIAMVRMPGPRPFGTGTFGTLRYGTANVLYPIGSDVGSPYGVGPYGVGPYETLPVGVPLEITFDTSQHVCEPGTWAPGPFRYAA